MRKILIIALVLALPLGLFAGNLFGELSLGYRMQGDSALKDVYGGGALQPALGIGTHLGKVHLVLTTGYFTNSGKTLGLEEKTTLSYIPLFVKAFYPLMMKSSVHSYVGLGAGFLFYKVDNDSPSLEDVSKTAFGFEPEVGLCRPIAKGKAVVLSLSYLFANAKPFDQTRNLGGLRFSVGFRAKF